MQKISTIGVLSAMESEFKSFTPYLSNIKKKRVGNLTYHIGKIGKFRIIGLVTGVGQANSAFSTGAIVHHFDPDILLFNGIAGAINNKLNIGDVLVGKNVFSAELLSIKSKVTGKYRKCKYGTFPDVKLSMDKCLEQHVRQLVKDRSEAVHFGTFASSDFFPIPDYIPEKFYSRTVDSIDMESAAFYQICKKMNKPCMAIRSISNYATPGKKIKLGSDAFQLSSKNASTFSNEFILSLE